MTFFNISIYQQADEEGKAINVREVMNTWILQMGYPVVNFTLDRENNRITLTQKHFLIDPHAQVTKPSPYKYVRRQLRHYLCSP